MSKLITDFREGCKTNGKKLLKKHEGIWILLAGDTDKDKQLKSFEVIRRIGCLNRIIFYDIITLFSFYYTYLIFHSTNLPIYYPLPSL